MAFEPIAINNTDHFCWVVFGHAPKLGEASWIHPALNLVPFASTVRKHDFEIRKITSYSALDRFKPKCIRLVLPTENLTMNSKPF